MKQKITPWAYRPKPDGYSKPLLYIIPAGIKLAFFLLMSFAVFIFGYYFLAAAIFILIFLSVNAKIRFPQLLRGSGPLLLICAAIFIFKSVNFFPPAFYPDGLFEGSIFCLRMIISFAAGALLFSTTTMGEIHGSLSRVEKILHLEKYKTSLGISLMLGFIPRFFEIWEGIETAWTNRKGRNNAAKFIVLIPLAIERLMEKAAQTAEALQSRGF